MAKPSSESPGSSPRRSGSRQAGSRRAEPRQSFGSPWPTTDSLRLALLARAQVDENLDLAEFFRQVYPPVLPAHQEVTLV